MGSRSKAGTQTRVWHEQTVVTPDGERHLGVRVEESPPHDGERIFGRAVVRRGPCRGRRTVWKARQRGRAIWLLHKDEEQKELFEKFEKVGKETA